MLEEKTFDTGEVIINYAEGPGDGPPLVLLHGSTGQWQDFGPLIPELQKRGYLYACDMRGHGKSGWADSGYRVVDFFPDIVAFVRHVVGEPAVLLGHSMGAIVSFGVASQIPELMRAIIVIDPPIQARELSIRQAPGPYYWFSGVLDVLNGRRSPEELLRSVDPNTGDEDINYLADRFRKIDPASLEVLLEDRFFDGFRPEQALRRVTCPALMIYGQLEMGSVVRESDLAFVQAHIAGCRAVQIEGTGHSPHEHRPERVMSLIADFLGGL